MISSTSNLAILFPLGCCLYIALRLNDGQVDDRRSGWAKSVAYCIVSLLIVFSLFGIMFRAGPISLVWGVVIAVLLVVVWMRGRALNRAVMFHTLARLPNDLARESAAAEFARRNSWSVSNRALICRQALAFGLSWPEAMQRSGIAKTSTEIMACRTMHALDQPFEKTVSPLLHPLRIQSEIERLLGRLLPLPWSLVGLPVVVMTMRLIVPTFKQMFEEFGLALPPMMRSYIAVSDFVIMTPLGALLILLALLLFAIVAAVVFAWLFPFVMQYWPYRWFATGYFRSLGLTSLAVALRREKDFASACGLAAGFMPIAYWSYRLKHAGQLSVEGHSPELALQHADLIRGSEAGSLAAAIHTGSFAWALEQVAIGATERMLRRYSVITQFVLVGFVFLLAIMFGWLAIAVIQSLAQMISAMA